MTPRPARPWHLWPIGLLAFLWHLAGSADYVLTVIDYPPYTSQVPPAWMEYFGSMPAWVTACWAVGVWVGLLGAILLLMREAAAPLTLALSFLGTLGASVWLLLLSDPPMQQVTGAGGVYVMVGATLAALLLWIYARWQRQNGVLD